MIYKIINTINGDFYIGKTSKTIEQRWKAHCYNAKKGVVTYLYNAIRKYGVENFQVEFLSEGLDKEEIFFISSLQPKYNMTRGGDGGDTSSSPRYKENRLQRRSYKGENNPNYGKLGEQSPNHGKIRTPEQIEKYKAAYKGKRIPVSIDGVLYDSVIAAARALGRSERYVRLHDQLNEWKY